MEDVGGRSSGRGVRHVTYEFSIGSRLKKKLSTARSWFTHAAHRPFRRASLRFPSGFSSGIVSRCVSPEAEGKHRGKPSAPFSLNFRQNGSRFTKRTDAKEIGARSKKTGLLARNGFPPSTTASFSRDSSVGRVQGGRSSCQLAASWALSHRLKAASKGTCVPGVFFFSF